MSNVFSPQAAKQVENWGAFSVEKTSSLPKRLDCPRHVTQLSALVDTWNQEQRKDIFQCFSKPVQNYPSSQEEKKIRCKLKDSLTSDGVDVIYRTQNIIAMPSSVISELNKVGESIDVGEAAEIFLGPVISGLSLLTRGFYAANRSASLEPSVLRRKNVVLQTFDSLRCAESGVKLSFQIAKLLTDAACVSQALAILGIVGAGLSAVKSTAELVIYCHSWAMASNRLKKIRKLEKEVEFICASAKMPGRELAQFKELLAKSETVLVKRLGNTRAKAIVYSLLFIGRVIMLVLVLVASHGLAVVIVGLVFSAAGTLARFGLAQEQKNRHQDLVKNLENNLLTTAEKRRHHMNSEFFIALLLMRLLEKGKDRRSQYLAWVMLRIILPQQAFLQTKYKNFSRLCSKSEASAWEYRAWVSHKESPLNGIESENELLNTYGIGQEERMELSAEGLDLAFKSARLLGA